MPKQKQEKGKKPRIPCPVSRKRFLERAEKMYPVTLGAPDSAIAGMVAKIKEFSTGSFGWYGNDRISILVGEKYVEATMQVTITVVNSKDAPKE